MRLSVCVPTHNQAEYLGVCLRSLIEQEVQPCEIVVSENHSTDSTRDILASVPNVRVVSPAKHVGMIENYQFCAGQAGGDWIAFMPSDDMAKPNFARDLLAGIEHFPQAAVVRAAHAFIDHEGRHLGNSSLLSVPQYSNSRDAFLQQLGGPKAFFEATAIRKSAFRITGGFDTRFRLFGDWALWISLSDAGAFATIKSIVSNYRIWGRKDRGDSRIASEMRDEIMIYRDHIYPRASLISEHHLEKAHRLAAGRGRVMLDRIYHAWTDVEVRRNIELLSEYAACIGVWRDVEALRTGTYRPAISRMLYSKARRFIRDSIERVLGWA